MINKQFKTVSYFQCKSARTEVNRHLMGDVSKSLNIPRIGSWDPKSDGRLFHNVGPEHLTETTR